MGEDPTGTWQHLRTQPRQRFTPGKFVSPHSACFDYDGNIFVVEWVDGGRVPKLKKIADYASSASRARMKLIESRPTFSPPPEK